MTPTSLQGWLGNTEEHMGAWGGHYYSPLARHHSLLTTNHVLSTRPWECTMDGDGASDSSLSGTSV